MSNLNSGNMWTLVAAFLTVFLLSSNADVLQIKGCGENSFRQRQPRRKQTAEGRIIDGKPTYYNEWPWQVSIQLTHPYLGSVGHWCGGVLLDSNWVITAAHCLVNRVFNFPMAPLWTVVVGKHNLRVRDTTEQFRRVSRVIIHPEFREYHNDVALLKLSEPVRLSREVSPICLPISKDIRKMELEGVKCVATGWGQVIQGHQNSVTLQRVEMPVVSNKLCHKAYGSKYKILIKPYHLCAGHLDGAKGTCVGDSGGPLQCVLHDGRWFLVGLTSFGSGCAKPGFPDVFTRMTSYMDWLLETMKKNP